jgi:hypothetical protein
VDERLLSGMNDQQLKMPAFLRGMSIDSKPDQTPERIESIARHALALRID